MTRHFFPSRRLQAAIWDAVSRVLAWPVLFRLNKVLFLVAIRGLGFPSRSNLRDSGEAWLIQRAISCDIRTFIDVGANTGDYSSEILSHRDTSVIAFEPQQSCSADLDMLRSSYGERFEWFCIALGNHPGFGKLHVVPRASSWSSFSDTSTLHGLETEVVNVEVSTLDSLLKNGKIRRAEFLKIDTEGFELEVLSGARDFIKKVRPKIIQIEFNRHHILRGVTLPEIARTVPPSYSLFQLMPWGRGLSRREKNDAETSIGYFSNFVFIRGDFVEHFS